MNGLDLPIRRCLSLSTARNGSHGHREGGANIFEPRLCGVRHVGGNAGRQTHPRRERVAPLPAPEHPRRSLFGRTESRTGEHNFPVRRLGIQNCRLVGSYILTSCECRISDAGVVADYDAGGEAKPLVDDICA